MLPYISIARPDHWFKNVFMILGIVLVFFYQPQSLKQLSQWSFWLSILWAFGTTCIIASSNYVINEILDAPTDRSHPIKKNRPIPSGQVYVPIAYAEWLFLGGLGLWMAWQVNVWFFGSAAALLFMGLVYNIPPVRSKELPYIDVLSESINNPIRLLLGWFAIAQTSIPPLSLMVAYWMAGAFFMAAKRWAEYRNIGDPEAAAAYRNSFRWYTLDRLMISMFFYAITCSLFIGVFIVRYKLELILSVPLIAGFFAYYLKIAFLPQSPVQYPEKLYKQTGLMIYLVVCTVAFLGLMFINIPVLYELFNVQPTAIDALWTLQWQ